MERGAFPNPEIVRRMRKFVLCRLMVDDPAPGSRSKEWSRLLRKEFRTAAIPYYAAFSPDGTVLGSIVYPGGSLDGFAVKLAGWMDEMLAKSGKSAK